MTNKECFHLLALQSHWLVLKIYFYYQTRQHQQRINSKPVCFSSSSTTSNSRCQPNLFSFLKATSSIKEKLSSFSLSSTKASSCSKSSSFPGSSSAESSGDQSGLFSFSKTEAWSGSKPILVFTFQYFTTHSESTNIVFKLNHYRKLKSMQCNIMKQPT